tara:strand:- start:2073 stop:2249 length:177 start_codon:yes stop_codon:yes gene_type:complete
MGQIPLKDAGCLFFVLGLFGVIFGVFMMFTQGFFKEILYITGGSLAAIVLGYLANKKG